MNSGGLSTPAMVLFPAILIIPGCGSPGSAADALDLSDMQDDTQRDLEDPVDENRDVTPDPAPDQDGAADPLPDPAELMDATPEDWGAEDEEASAGFCPDVAGGIVYRMTEDFVPSPETPTLTFMVPCEGGLTFSRIIVELDLTHGGWFEADPDGTHGIFQLTRGTRWRSNLYGFMTMFGPPRDEVRVISNIDLAAGEVLRLNRTGLPLEAGTTYHVRYAYDTAVHERRLLITAGSDVVVDMSDAQTVDEVSTLAPGFQMILATIYAGDLGPEVPTYGWRYASLCIQVLP